MLIIDTHELAWAAGFFDGEGTTHLRKKLGNSRFAMLSVTQVNKELLVRFQKAVGNIGHIYGPYSRSQTPKRKPIHRWHATNFSHTQATIAMLWKWLGHEKRAQAKRALMACRDNPGRKPGEYNRKVNSELMKKRWSDPITRAKMLENSRITRDKLAASRRGKPATAQQLENLKLGREKRWSDYRKRIGVSD